MAWENKKHEGYRKDKSMRYNTETGETRTRRSEWEEQEDGTYKKEVVWTIWNKDGSFKEELKRKRKDNSDLLDWDDDVFVVSSYINGNKRDELKFDE